MYEVQIINRGPEGIRGHKQFRLTEADSDELHKRIAAGVDGGAVAIDQFLSGLEPFTPERDAKQKADAKAQAEAADAQPANGKKSKAAK